MSIKTFLGLEERVKIKRYIDNGYSLFLISQCLKRSKNTIIVEVNKNGGREIYDPVAAQNNADLNKKIRLKALHKGRNSQTQGRTSFKERIANLEMQVEILTETIRNLKR